MNRRETRQMSKKLGILQHKNKLPFNQRMELVRANQENGKKKQDELRESVELYKTQVAEDKESAMIYNIAEHLANVKELPVIDTMKEAKEVYIKMMKN
jgi:hypothetical protein